MIVCCKKAHCYLEIGNPWRPRGRYWELEKKSKFAEEPRALACGQAPEWGIDRVKRKNSQPGKPLFTACFLSLPYTQLGSLHTGHWGSYSSSLLFFVKFVPFPCPHYLTLSLQGDVYEWNHSISVITIWFLLVFDGTLWEVNYTTWQHINVNVYYFEFCHGWVSCVALDAPLCQQPQILITPLHIFWYIYFGTCWDNFFKPQTENQIPCMFDQAVIFLEK